MNWKKIYGLSLRHFYLIKSSFPRILDLIYWPSIQIFLWGFISKFFTMSSEYYNNTVGVILSAAILYDFLFRASISYNMMFLEEIWSRNFTNLFISPIKIKEIIEGKERADKIQESILLQMNDLYDDPSKLTPELEKKIREMKTKPEITMWQGGNIY